MYLDRVGAESEPVTFSWRPRDCSLYALAVGEGVQDVEYTTEGNAGADQKVHPTFAFAIVAALADAWPDPCFGTGDFAIDRVVLGEQGLIIDRPLAPEGAVTAGTRVEGIYDKGSGALVVLDQQANDATTGTRCFSSTVGLFVTGEGGFGGVPAPARSRGKVPPRGPDHCVVQPILPIQTLLYRHAGNDANPAHIDPAFAARAGWDGPILTGQNSLGFASRAIVHTALGSQPERLRSIFGRFAAPAFNGDVLTIEIWTEGVGSDDDGHHLAAFRVRNQHGTVVVDRGSAAFE
jgi:acyl dehydratase